MKEFVITQDFGLAPRDFFTAALLQPEQVLRLHTKLGNSEGLKLGCIERDHCINPRIARTLVEPKVTGSLSDGFTYNARWCLIPLSSHRSRCTISVQCDFKGSYLSDAVEAQGADLVRRSLLQWNEACVSVIADYKPEASIDSGNEEAPLTSEEERSIPGAAEAPIERRSSLQVDSAFRAPAPLSAAARYALSRTASPAPIRALSPPFVAARSTPDSGSDDETKGFVDADVPTAKQDAALATLQTEISIVKTHIAVLQGRLSAAQAGDPNSTVTRERIAEIEALLKTAESSRREKEKMLAARLSEVERRLGNIRSYLTWKTGAVAAVVFFVWPFVAFEIWRRFRSMDGVAGIYAVMHSRLFRKK